MVVELAGVDEAVDGWDVLVVERLEDGLGDGETGLAGRKIAVGGEIVEGEGQLLGFGGDEED